MQSCAVVNVAIVHVPGTCVVRLFSEWHRPQKDADEAAEAVAEGEMPMPIYALIHSHARLTDQERQQLIDGLKATFGPSNGSADHDSDD
jgi:hypothetical protein